jgi:tetratricopeptide (TPR) repeat protein
MIRQARKSKFHIASLCLFLFGWPAQAPSASAQSPLLDTPSKESFANRDGEIVGTVYLNRRAEPAPQVLVTIRSTTSGLSQSALTDPAGRFEVREIPQGTYEVSAAGQGRGFASTITQVGLLPTEVLLYLDSSSEPRHYTVPVRELEIPSKAQSEYERGLDRLAKSDFPGSLAHFNKAATVYPAYYEAFYHMGVAEFRLNHQDKAVEAFQKAIDLSGGHYARPQFAYGLILCHQQKAQEAERLIRRGLQADRDSAEGYLFLGIALLGQNRLEEAEKSLGEALLRKPQYPDVYLALADLHAKRKDYRAQVQDLDIYLELVPSSPGSDYVRKVREAAKHLVPEP